ncbi:AraC family transcriptional regulator [Acidovorax sp. 22279]|uniref:AraC family transcriptional regulator n=1 Tax=Acidovorax sp. 22279 TaxID=3453900 RepID=UPI003F8428DA
MSSMPITVPQCKVSTDLVPPHERVGFWEAHNASELIGLRCTSYAGEGLEATERNFDLGSLRVADVAGNEHVIERTPALLRRHPKNSVFIAMVVEGEAFFYQKGRCITAQAGDVLAYRTSDPYLCGFSRRARQFLVDLPAPLLLDEDASILPTGPTKFDFARQGGQSFRAELDRTLRNFIDRPLARDAAKAAERISVLCRALLTQSSGVGWSGASSEVARLCAETYIAEHLADAGLDAAAVARHVCLSPRHLNRLFAGKGCTVTGWIWQCRLETAQQMLADPARRRLTVGDVAFQCGFASPAHFSSAFKAKFGQPPSQHRRGHCR